MSQTFTIVLKQDRDREFARRAVDRAPMGMQVRVSKPKRTTEQNALLHALLSDLVDQLPWPLDTGELHDIEWWKRTCTFGWLLDINEHPEIVLSPDGQKMALLLPHTSDLDTEECASLSEWIMAFGAQNGVVFKEPDRGPEPPPPSPEDYR